MREEKRERDGFAGPPRRKRNDDGAGLTTFGIDNGANVQRENETEYEGKS
jgi:hypothetical protein